MKDKKKKKSKNINKKIQLIGSIVKVSSIPLNSYAGTGTGATDGGATFGATVSCPTAIACPTTATLYGCGC